MAIKLASSFGIRAGVAAAALVAASAASATPVAAVPALTAPAMSAHMINNSVGALVGQYAPCDASDRWAAAQSGMGAITRAASPTRSATSRSGYAPRRTSAASAILNGEMSALERIRMQQAGNAPEQQVAASQSDDVGYLEPAASGTRSGLTACPVEPASFSAYGKSRVFKTPNALDFLASRRVPISRTNFDSDWRRVAGEPVSATFRNAFDQGVTPSMDVLEAVNRWVNREIAYVEDRELFGQADYWAGASLTMVLRRGDCEDIALTKMQMLTAAGFDRADMFLTIARDTVRRSDHALLVVRINGRFVVLDNATDTLLDGAYSHDYTPVLSFNDTSTWVHGY